MEIVTNKHLIENSDAGFILAGKCFADGSSVYGGKQFAFDLPSNGHAVILSRSLKETFEKGLAHNPVSYLYRGEVQGDYPMQPNEPALSTTFRIIRIMPVLTLKQDNKELMHLTLRGHGASDAGNWGCASSLVSSEINQRSIYATLNRETGLLIDGQVAVFEPAVRQEISEQNKIYFDAKTTKRNIAKDVPELKAAFEKGGDLTSIATKFNLPEKHDNVYFFGAMLKDLKCIAYDNPEQRTLTLIFPLVAEIPSGSVVTPFNGEGYDGPAALVNTKFLRKENSLKKEGDSKAPDIMPLIPGLRELVIGN